MNTRPAIIRVSFANNCGKASQKTVLPGLVYPMHAGARRYSAAIAALR